MQVEILLFATLKDLAGTNRLTLDLSLSTATVSDVRVSLAQRYPGLADHLKAAIASVNQEYAFAGDSVNEGDEVAFFPPVSGGADLPEVIRLADSPIDHDELIAAITTPNTGAVCLFSGFVRGATDKEGHLAQTDYLEYEAYEPMALAKMQQVAQEIRERWSAVQGIAIVQRIGRLAVGQNTILIACSSGHRDQGCFEAARYGIDRLKEIVPVWKKEVGRDGATWIEGEYLPSESDKRH
ncbi:MAG: molybdopterin converting factor subunit 1 [Anaerolineae bacterium]|jgi:molybdopterin synthase catalytic subunit|nr:molybdopterin converting factor subunit 1 [Anaerolineae bacterium]